MGGAERTIYEVGKRLVASGNEMKWFSVKEVSMPTNETYSGISIIRLPNNLTAHLSVPIILKKEKYDVVVDDMGHAVPWGSENFHHARGTVFFHHLHRRTLKGQVSLPQRILISGLEAIYPLIYRDWPFISESNSSINDLISLGIDRRRIVKILPGLNQENFQKFDKTEFPSIVYFGGVKDYKRPWEAVYILKNLQEILKDTHLYFVGEGHSLTTVKQISEDIGVAHSITFTGRLSDTELKKVVGKSWVNIHSSVAEGFGFSIIESSALGTPTIAYDVPGVNEAIIDGSNGILVENGNRNEMLKALLRILQGYPDDWASRSTEVAKKYTWDKTADLWEGHLQEISGL